MYWNLRTNVIQFASKYQWIMPQFALFRCYTCQLASGLVTAEQSCPNMGRIDRIWRLLSKSTCMFMCAHYIKTPCQWGRITLEGWYYSIALGLKMLFLYGSFGFRALRTNMIMFERGHFFARNPVEYATRRFVSIKIYYVQREWRRVWGWTAWSVTPDIESLYVLLEDR